MYGEARNNLSRSLEVIETERPSADVQLASITRFVTPRRALLAMMLLQLLWLAVIWLTGAATAVHKLPPLILYTFFTGLLVALMPARLRERLERTVDYLSQREKVALLLLSSLLLIGGTFYAAQQRLWPFDEEASYEAAVIVAQTGIPGLLDNYQNWGWLATQHPPLAPVVYGQFVNLLGEHLLIARLVSLFFSLGTGLLTYFIGTELYGKKTGLIAAWFLFTFPLFMRLSATAMVEPMLTFFFALTLYLVLLWVHRRWWPYLLAMGVAVGVGLVTKYTMVFVAPIVLGFILLRGSRRQIIQSLMVLTVAALLFGTIWVLVASRINVLQIQLETIGHYAGLVLTNRYGRNLLFETITNRLPSALGVYNLPLIVLGGLLLVRRRSRVDWMILLWVTAVWLPLFLTLPDHRYFMVSFPAVAILIAASFQLIPKLLDRALLLAILYCAGSLYLFVDWSRAAQLFIN